MSSPLLAILLAAKPLWGLVLHVPSEYSTIQSALDLSLPADTILVAPGSYQETLVTPGHTLSIASHFLGTNDPEFIEETILDGAFQGSCITSSIGTLDTLFVTGLKLVRGHGSFSPNRSGGAIHLNEEANIHIDNCILENNRSEHDGAILFGDFGVQLGSVEISNTRVRVYSDGSINLFDGYQLASNSSRSFRLSNVYVTGMDSPTLIALLLSDELVIDGLAVDSVDTPDSEFIKPMLTLASFGNVEADSISISSCNSQSGGFIEIASLDGHVYLNDLTMNACSSFANCEIGAASLRVSADSLFADNIKLHDLYSVSGYSAGTISADLFGQITNLEVQGCHSGALPPQVVGGCVNGKTLRTTNCNIQYSRFLNNTSSIFALHQIGNMQWLEESGLCLEYIITHPDANWLINNCQFQGNSAHDSDNYSSAYVLRAANVGRALYVSLPPQPDRVSFQLDSCLFQDNFINNPAPEGPTASNLETRSVGSTVEINCATQSGHFAPRITVSNSLFENNDDGALAVLGYRRLVLENVSISACDRMGILCFGDSTDIRNAFISGVDAWREDYSYPYTTSSYQGALLAHSSISTIVSNSTVHDNHVSNLFTFSQTADHAIQNTLLMSNEYNSLFFPGEDSLEINYPTINYSLMNFLFTGQGNIVSFEYPFSSVYGPPFLNENSQAIDAGDPLEAFNDQEDPENPGFALWPSQGGLRNDIGFTGGPWAQGLDHLVAVEEPAAETPLRPSSLRLEPAAPNPFNPVTRLKLHLDQDGPALARLYNIRGQLVRTLLDEDLIAGTHVLRVDGSRLASGVYIVAAQSGGKHQQQKILLLK